MSCSASEGGQTLFELEAAGWSESPSQSAGAPVASNQSGWMTTWQVEQAIMPLQAHSRYSP
eukprot:CAMPEP_0184418412 /NCGR_PEP_ID=MMETSP0738-20130409/27472_1 /TAXON_ID=385413 /ORGANISM="Thalassiosira miniscula, Strain CCMP1093" /LENGTH=60 /DNA_ID=CAMNT_0026778527 /DNA_START=26 /DNA_END=204 /DNA_ORIENTATION=+